MYLAKILPLDSFLSESKAHLGTRAIFPLNLILTFGVVVISLVLEGSPNETICVQYVSSGLFLSVEVSIQDEAMDVAQSAPQEAHYRVDVICLLP